MHFVLIYGVRTTKLKNPFRGLAGKPEEKNSLINLLVDGRIFL